MIKEWLAAYEPANKAQAEFALREIMQEIALAGLQRSGFFEKAAFYGGTALRIFHGLDRFSEDLDFSLLEKNMDFSLQTYLGAIVTEFESLGMQVSIKEKKKTVSTNIDSAFLKTETLWRELLLEDIIPQAGVATPHIRIKIEVDTEPPPGFATEENLLIRPFSFYVKCFTLPNLFAGKLHALLFRKWQKRVKGRDWYDMEWYVRKGVSLHLDHLALRAADSGDWSKPAMTQKEFHTLLRQRIDTVSFSNIKEDIVRFIKNDGELEIWSPQYFNDLAKKITFK